MVSPTDIPPLACQVCGSPDWMAVRPGYAYRPAGDGVVELHPDPPTPPVAWCAAHWPWARGAAVMEAI